MITAAKASVQVCVLCKATKSAYNVEITPFYEIGFCVGCFDFSDLAAQDSITKKGVTMHVLRVPERKPRISSCNSLSNHE